MQTLPACRRQTGSKLTRGSFLVSVPPFGQKQPNVPGFQCAANLSLGGQMGGPMAGLAPLIGEVLGVERAPIAVVEEGLRHSVRIGDAIDFEVEDIVPFGIETGEPARLVGVFHPVGSELTAAEATRSQISAFGIEYEGKTGLSAPFSWAA
jgi:hypothetical protein